MNNKSETEYFERVLDKIASAFRRGDYSRASILLDSLNEYTKAHCRLVEMADNILNNVENGPNH